MRSLRVTRHFVLAIGTILLTACAVLVPSPILEAVYSDHRDDPPEYLALCSQMGVKINRRAQDVQGVLVEDDSTAGLNPRASLYIRSLLESGFSFVELWQPKANVSEYAYEQGYHRYWVTDRGDPRCGMFERDRNGRPGDSVWGQRNAVWKNRCIAAERISMPRVEYRYRREYRPYSDHAQGKIWLSRRSVVASGTGEVLAEYVHFGLTWNDYNEYPLGIRTRGCQQEPPKEFGITDVLSPVGQPALPPMSDEERRRYMRGEGLPTERRR